MATQYLQTIEDFDLAYGGSPWGGMVHTWLTKDDPLLSTTSGNYQTRYAAYVWWQLNAEPNIFSIQDRSEWPQESGWRVLRDVPATKAYRVAENAVIPETLKPVYDIISQKPQTAYTAFDLSEIAGILSRGQEALAFDQLRQDMAKMHGLGIAEQLFARADSAPYTNGFTSIDVIVGSNSRLASLTAAATNKQDVYGIDRDAGAGWTDAEVLHNSAVPRPLSLDLIDSLDRAVSENTGSYSSDGVVWVTGYATHEKWGRLLQAQQRFNEANFTTKNFKSVSTVAGTDAGYRLATYNQKPIIVSQHAPKNQAADDATSVPGIWRLDLNYLKLHLALPTVYREAGVNTAQEILLGRFGTEAGFRTVGDEICSFFAAQGSLLDLAL
jgi:hypothetical protein